MFKNEKNDEKLESVSTIKAADSHTVTTTSKISKLELSEEDAVIPVLIDGTFL